MDLSGQSFGRFLALEKIGQGGMATVWRAQDTLLGREIALKVLDERFADSPKVRRRFLHEARNAAALNHPGIVSVLETGESQGLPFIALSLVRGETLSQRLNRSLLPLPAAVRIVMEAAEALEHAHAHGVIHRDVTSRNIMVAAEGHVVVLDFGLARAIWDTRLTTSEVALGTAAYMSPEVIRGGHADRRSDVYGLGVVLYEALTGRFPYQGEHPQGLLYAALHLEPDPPSGIRPEIPPKLEYIVLRAISKEPAARYQSAAELRAALQVLDLGDESAAEQTPPHEDGGAGHHLPERSWQASAPTRPHPLYVAVLSFRVQEDAPDADGSCRSLAGHLPETLGCILARHEAIRIVASEGSATQEVDREGLMRLARRLGANVLVRGTVARAGSLIRVSFSALDAWRGVQLAGGIVDGSAFKIFDIEDEVGRRLAAALGLSAKEAVKAARPPDPAAKERYAQALAYLKRYDNEASVDGAIRLLEELVTSVGDDAFLHAALTRAYLCKSNLTGDRTWEARAASICALALRLAPDRIEVQVALGELKRFTGDLEGALAAFDRALEMAPEDAEGMLGRARVLWESGKQEEAEKASRRAVALRPDDWRAHSLLGWIYNSSGSAERALEPLRRVVELTPDNARGRLNLGNALYWLGRFDEAIEAYRKSLAIQPNDEAYSNLGSALYFQGCEAEALEALRRATELTPTNPVWWGNYGNACHWVPGREAQARDALERAIALMRERLEHNASIGEWWARLGGWLANLDRFEEALEAIQRAVSLSPHDTVCLSRAGYVHFRTGDRDRAVHWFREAVRHGYPLADLRHSRELVSLWQDPEACRALEEASDEVRSRQRKGAAHEALQD